MASMQGWKAGRQAGRCMASGQPASRPAGLAAAGAGQPKTSMHCSEQACGRAQRLIQTQPSSLPSHLGPHGHALHHGCLRLEGGKALGGAATAAAAIAATVASTAAAVAATLHGTTLHGAAAHLGARLAATHHPGHKGGAGGRACSRAAGRRSKKGRGEDASITRWSAALGRICMLTAPAPLVNDSCRSVHSMVPPPAACKPAGNTLQTPSRPAHPGPSQPAVATGCLLACGPARAPAAAGSRESPGCGA